MANRKQPFYERSNLGGVQKIYDDRQEITEATGVVQLVLGTSVKVQIVGSNRFVDADVINGVAVDMGKSVHMTKDPASKRWKVDGGSTSSDAVALAGLALSDLASSSSSAGSSGSQDDLLVYLARRIR